ncbi:MAG: carbamoyltransferase HypF [Lachnospiraceae bacterium]|nr:carbamoyltransferase HypF [Lachnospiraceae bacterium]
MARIGANIRVSGIVQGVGFRPFIHKQITDHSLCGFIRNTSQGVEIEIEGEDDRVRLFIDELWTKAPALAVVRDVQAVFYHELKDYTDFRILSSQVLPGRQALISPDVGLCEDCRRELFDSKNRRYRYPFINCTNCGPRYTIVKDVPYDRPLTSMGKFPMCGPCDAEYHDIADRRYHAQPTCCPDCGPQLEYFETAGFPKPETAPEGEGEAALAAAVRLLEQGGILCVKGLGGMHLACRADLEESVLALRRRKEREEKPFALMARDLDAVRAVCEITPAEEALLKRRQRPIVLLKKKDPAAFGFLSENSRLGIMLPYTPLHELLLNDGPALLVMTSANLSDKPILKDNEDALRELAGIADGFLLHNRDIVARCDDSLLWELDGKPYFARRSRGYAPEPIEPETLSFSRSILACGAEQKASFAISKLPVDGSGPAQVFLSPHIGDCKNWETLSHYEDTISHYEKLFDLKPQALVCDLHPDFLTTRYAERRAAAEGLPLIRVQHHHAHMAACLADNGLSGRSLGIIWDGSGYGTDGTVWGGEFLLGDSSDFTRAASLRPFRLPGGDKAVREIRRLAVSLLEDAAKWAAENRREVLPALEAERLSLTKDAAAAAALRQLESGINCPLSSSMGRLFDAVSCLLGICAQASYEGQAAILLEAAAETGARETLSYGLLTGQGRLLFDERPMTAELIRLKREENVPPARLAAMFLNTLVRMSTEICRRLKDELPPPQRFEQIVLSGGTFQNMFLVEKLPRALEKEGFRVYHHKQVSANDEGLCLGQLAVAAARLK